MTSDLGHGCQLARGSLTDGKCSTHIMVELVWKPSRVSSTDKVFSIFFSSTTVSWAIICINCVRICDLHQAAALKCPYFWNVFCRTEHWARRWVSAVTLPPLCPFKAILHWSFHNYEKRIGRKKTLFLLGSWYWWALLCAGHLDICEYKCSTFTL